MSALDGLRIARPCPASWSAMEGDDRVRHCSRCRLNVYNLSAMTEAEALRLLAETEGRRCIRLYRRADGTVLTRDCPGPTPEPASAGRRVAMAAALAGALVAADAVVDRAVDLVAPEVETVELMMPPVDDGEWLAGEMVAPTGDQWLDGEMTMGMMAPPPPPPPIEPAN